MASPRHGSAAVTGDPDSCAAIVAASEAGIRPDASRHSGRSASLLRRVAVLLGLPGNPPDAIDAARSKVRTASCPRRSVSRHRRSLGGRSTSVRGVSYVGFPAVVKPEFGVSAVGWSAMMSILPEVYAMVRDAVSADQHLFRSETTCWSSSTDGVEFDVDLITRRRVCVLERPQNWLTVEPSFRRPACIAADHNRPGRSPVDLSIETAKRFGLHRGVLHIGQVQVSQGRGSSVNAHGRQPCRQNRAQCGRRPRRGYGSLLRTPSNVKPSRKPRCTALTDAGLRALAVSAALPLPTELPRGCLSLTIDSVEEVGARDGAEDARQCSRDITLMAKDSEVGRSRRGSRTCLVEPADRCEPCARSVQRESKPTVLATLSASMSPGFRHCDAPCAVLPLWTWVPLGPWRCYEHRSPARALLSLGPLDGSTGTCRPLSPDVIIRRDWCDAVHRNLGA